MQPSTLLSLLSLSLTLSSSSALNPLPSSPNWDPFERLSKNDSALLIVDHQVGLFQLVRDWDATLYRQNMLSHAALGALFHLPVVITSSADTGANGPVPREITDMYPGTEIVRREGEINAWDSPAFRAAVRATGKKQMIVAGIVTDVCTALLAQSLRAEGFSVFANVEASGTTTPLIRDIANARMQSAGVHLVSSFAILADLMRDWRSEAPGVKEVLAFVDEYFPAYGMLGRGFEAAVGERNGTVG